MTSLLLDNLIGQIEVFNALEIKAAEEYTALAEEIKNPEFKKVIEQIKADELYHAKICREIIDFLKTKGG